jgi:hypothetical protein
LEPSEANPYDQAAESLVRDLLTDLEREAAREDLPQNLRLLSQRGAEQVAELRRPSRRPTPSASGVWGLSEDDRRPDGFPSLVPRWARGTEVLTALQTSIDVDETQDPVTVTVHWERVPRNLRREAASLASDLVDSYQPRPKGGRPRKSSTELGRRTG